ncbi:MAG: menaquinone-dependent protoporphyrinogen IX dehydrogenase [Moraxellaceae bacterium]|nr:menaquinone-dependent protoporphyrinogen IX dehydrogenase [Moraxellaceae bacterium]
MKNILILYSSVDGHTKTICQFIVDKLHNKDSVIHLKQVSEFKQQALVDLSAYDMLILGASVRYGKHRADVVQFIETYKDELANIPTAFFSVNLVARKPEKNTVETNVYIKKFLQLVDWQPTVVDVFAGKLDYARYGIFDKLIIKFIMWLTKGETKSDKPIVYTDWQRVENFVQCIEDVL